MPSNPVSCTKRSFIFWQLICSLRENEQREYLYLPGALVHFACCLLADRADTIICFSIALAYPASVQDFGPDARAGIQGDYRCIDVSVPGFRRARLAYVHRHRCLRFKYFFKWNSTSYIV